MSAPVENRAVTASGTGTGPGGVSRVDAVGVSADVAVSAERLPAPVPLATAPVAAIASPLALLGDPDAAVCLDGVCEIPAR